MILASPHPTTVNNQKLNKYQRSLQGLHEWIRGTNGYEFTSSRILLNPSSDTILNDQVPPKS